MILLGVVNVLATGHVWAAFSEPNALVATSVCSDSVSLSWADPNPGDSGERTVQVQRSTRNSIRGFSTIATLPAYTTSYVDIGVSASSTNYYRVVAVNAKKRKYRSEPITVVTPAPVTVTEQTADIPDTGATDYTVAVIAGNACGWSVESMDSWIAINGTTAGTGSGTISVSVAENTSTNSRTGTVRVAGKAVKVPQGGKRCAATLSPTSATTAASGGSGNFTISTGSSCAWAATAGAGWIHTSSSGSGNGTVSYTVDSNTDVISRTGIISVGGKSFTITQSAGGVTVTTSSAPTAGGSTTGGGTFNSGSAVTVVATPNACYSFANWTESGVVVSTSASYSFTASGNRTLVANFSQMTYAVATGASPSTGGITSGGGNKMCGSSVTVSAAANAGYNFVNWMENGTVVSTAANYSFMAAANRSLMATFSSVPTYTITASSSPVAGGSTSGGGTFVSGSTATVVATPNSCYSFANWTENGVIVSTSASYSFTVTGNRALVANFSQQTYTITTGAAPSAGGTASGGGTKICGSTVTVSATANAGYNFVNWTESGVVVTTAASYSFTATGNRTLVANFSTVPTYTIATSSAPAAGGSTSGGGTFVSGSTVTVVATPASCYAFANWTENGVIVSTSASYSFTVAGNRTLVANFSQTSYAITTSSSPSAGGTTSGGGTKSCGSTVTVSATANAGYNFVNWTEGGVVVTTAASYSFTATGNRTLVANFSTVPTYTIATSSSPSAGGSANGGGTFASGSTVNLVATPGSCYTFANWTENGVIVSTSASYSFTAAGNRTLVANFSQTSYAITTASSPSAGGTTSGGGAKVCGSAVTVSATANAGYNFVNWTESGVVVTTAASYSFTATGNRTLVANFSTVPSYTVGTSSSPAAGGSTSGGGTFVNGSTATVVATPNSCYTFANWTESGVIVSTSASYSFAVTGSRTLVANFSQQTYSIAASALPSAGGTVSGGGTKACGSSVTVSASANAGYTFANWTESGVIVSTSASYTFTAAANRTLVANFNAMPNYTISTSSSPSAGGSTSGGGTFVSGSSVTVVATANSGYNFANWTENGTVVGTSASYTFSAASSRTLVANFSAVTASYTITTSSSPAAGGSTSGGGTKTSGTTATVTATANSGYSFVNWTESGAQVSASSSYTFTVTGNRTLVANFAAISGPWAMTIGGSSVDSGNAVGADAAGNIFVAGYFMGTANFGGTTLTSAGAADIFVAKYSPSGTMLWAKRFGGTGDDQALALAVDRTSGDVVVTGFFSGSVPFGVTTFNCISGRDIFLVKLAGATGAVSWTKQIGGQWGVDGEDIGYGVAIDQRNGDVVMTGQVSGWFDVGFGWVITTSSSSDTVLTRLSSSGAYQWAKTFVANGVDRGTAVAVDASGNILLAGNVSGAIDLGGGALPLGGWSPDAYVTKLTPTGTHIWSVGFGNEYYTGVSGIAVDASGNVAITGFFSQTINFGTGDLTAINTSGYLVKLAAANGATVWSRAFVASANASGNAVTFDAAGNAVVTGNFYMNCDFGGGSFSAPSSIHDGFLAKYSSATGAHLSSQRFGGTGDDRGFGVTLDASGNTIVAGTTGGGDFSGATLTTAGSNDIFLMKLAP